jgi:RNA ligase
MNKYELKEFVLNNPKLVSMKPAGDGIFVLKYRKSVFYDNLWNDFLEECRGTIVDADFNVVSRPFTKIYNYGVEAKAPVLADNTLVTAYRKVNGFMVAMTWYNNDILVSTTGSTQNDYVDYAKEMMLKHQCWADWQMEILAAKGMTLMFECVHPNDPHIVPEDAGMYLLGSRKNTWDAKVEMYGVSKSNRVKDYALACLKCNYAESYVLPLSELVAKSKQVRHEGFVFYTEDGVSAKIKSPYYLTSKWVARNPRTDKLVNMEADIKKNLDEEYYPLVDAIRANIVEYTAMNEQERLTWVRNYLELV